MPQVDVIMNVRQARKDVSVVDIHGQINAFAENVLMTAYAEATENGVKAVVLNFDYLEYMNSGGIGLLVTLLIRAQRQGQRLLACGLNEHYQQIFELTRLNEAIAVYPTEAQAEAAVV